MMQLSVLIACEHNTPDEDGDQFLFITQKQKLNQRLEKTLINKLSLLLKEELTPDDNYLE